MVEMRYSFLSASLILLASGCEHGKAHPPGPVQQASAASMHNDVADAEADYLSAKRAYLASLDADLKRGTPDSVLNARDDAAISDLAGRLRKIFGPGRASFAAHDTNNVSTLLPTDMEFGAVDGIGYQLADSVRVLVTTRGLLMGYLQERAAAGDSVLPRDPASALTYGELYAEAFPEDAAVLRYADIPVDSAAQLGVAAAMLVARAQDIGPVTPQDVMVSVVRGNRIYFAEAPARAAIAPMASCVAMWRDVERKRDSLVANAPNPSDTARLSSMRVAEHIEEQGDTLVRRCYAEHVSADPQFAVLAQQVASIVRRLGPQ